MSKQKPNATQLSLFSDEPEETSIPARLTPVMQVVTPPLLVISTRVNYLKMSPQQVAEARVWLQVWGKAHNYPAFDFPIGSGRMGDYRGGTIFQGEQHWLDVMNCQDIEFFMKAIEHIQLSTSKNDTEDMRTCEICKVLQPPFRALHIARRHAKE